MTSRQTTDMFPAYRMRPFLLLPLVSACSLTDPRLPAGAERFTPPSVYAQWWDLTKECSGLSGNLSDVTWYRVPGTYYIPLGDGSSVNGLWDAVGNRIVLASASQFEGDLVRHEMLHALLRSAGHPRPAFIGLCDGTLVCIERCITEGNPAPQQDPAAQLVNPSALQIGVEVKPSSPSTTTNDGSFIMFVTALNPGPSPVIVQLPPSGDAGPSVSFSFRVIGASGTKSYDMRANVPETTRFAPYEVKRFIFDFHIGAGSTRYEESPGTYRFEGAYGGVWAANPPTVTVAP